MKSLDFQNKIQLESVISLEDLNEKLFASIKYNKNTILVKTFIIPEEIQVVLDACVEDFLANYEQNNDENRLPYTQCLYKLLLLKLCTNLELDFQNINFNIVASDLADCIFAQIKNYEEVWKLILDTISQKVLAYSLNLIATSLPSDKALKENVADMQATLKELQNNNPEILKYLVKEITTQDIKDNAKEELKQEKEQKKEKTKTNKEHIKAIEEDVDAVLEGR